jgi:hypothetical protein
MLESEKKKVQLKTAAQRQGLAGHQTQLEMLAWASVMGDDA